MVRWIPLLLLALAWVPDAAVGQPAGDYMRRRPEPARQGWWGYPGPVVSGGSYQRPYPYHLDYYRKAYGGDYSPYFGNLYGPPNVVLGTPYVGYGVPPVGAPSPAGPAAAATVCPHCGGALQLVAPAPPNP